MQETSTQRSLATHLRSPSRTCLTPECLPLVVLLELLCFSFPQVRQIEITLLSLPQDRLHFHNFSGHSVSASLSGRGEPGFSQFQSH